MIGRPFGLEGQGRNIILEQIPASDVESIELITNPSAKYEAEGSVGIINVILEKNKNQGFGYNGNLGLNLGTGDKYNGQFNISMKNNKFSLYGNYSYNTRNFLSSGYNDMDYFNNTAISSSSQSDSIVTAVGQGAEAALSISEDLMNPYWLKKDAAAAN